MTEKMKCICHSKAWNSPRTKNAGYFNAKICLY
nr:MAG TPA: hypothetical protein [Caudoviricetes sp.]